MKKNLLMPFFRVVRKIAPVKCFKKFALKSNRYGSCFLLGRNALEQELEVFNEMTTENAKKHLWSEEARLELLKRGDYTLVSEISTYDEFMLILNTKDDNLIEKAVDVYTPKKSNILDLLFRIRIENGFRSAASWMKKFPKLFKNISAKDILEYKASEKYEKQKFILELCENNEFMAADFLEEIRDVVGDIFYFRTSEDGRFFEKIVTKAYNLGDNVAFFMPVIKIWARSLYNAIRVREDGYDYINAALEDVKNGFSQYTYIENIKDIKIEGELSMVENAYAWLAKAYKNKHNYDIVVYMQQLIPEIKPKVVPGVIEELEKAFIKKQ